jgi:hypothetical protein
MTAYDLTDPAPTPKRGFKLPPALTAILIALAVAAAGWVVYRFVYSSVRTYDLTQYEPNDGPAARARSRLAAGLSGNGNIGSVIRRDNGGDIRLPAARVQIRKTAGREDVNSGYYDLRSVVDPADYEVYLARAAALSATATQIKPEQREKLKAITFRADFVRDDGEKKTLLDLWQKYEAAPAADQPAVSRELVQATSRLAMEAMPQVKANFAAAAKEVRAVLSEREINDLRTRRGR